MSPLILNIRSLGVTCSAPQVQPGYPSRDVRGCLPNKTPHLDDSQQPALKLDHPTSQARRPNICDTRCKVSAIKPKVAVGHPHGLQRRLSTLSVICTSQAKPSWQGNTTSNQFPFVLRSLCAQRHDDVCVGFSCCPATGSRLPIEGGFRLVCHITPDPISRSTSATHKTAKRRMPGNMPSTSCFTRRQLRSRYRASRIMASGGLSSTRGHVFIPDRGQLTPILFLW